MNENIKYYRLSHNLKQSEFAALLGISQNHLSQIENGKRNASLELIDKIVDKLDMTYDEIFSAYIRPIAENACQVGEVLKWIRKKKHISIEDLAEAVGEPPNTIKKWEKDGSQITIDKLDMLLSALNVSLDYIHGNADDPTPVATPPSLKVEPVKKVSLIQNSTPATQGSGLQNVSDVSDVAYIFEKDDLIEIPLYDVETVASSWADCLYSAIPEGVKKIYVEKDSFERLDKERAPFAIVMTNDSMTGANIDSGDSLVISPADTVKSGDVAFACHGDMWLVRWIYLKPDGSIELHAANPNYTPIIVEREHAEDKRWFRLVGKIIEIRHKPITGI